MVSHRIVACEGDPNPALGHPKVYINLDTHEPVIFDNEIIQLRLLRFYFNYILETLIKGKLSFRNWTVGFQIVLRLLGSTVFFARSVIYLPSFLSRVGVRTRDLWLFAEHVIVN